MTALELLARVRVRMMTLPRRAADRQRAIDALLRGRAAVGGPPQKGPGV